MIYEFRCRQCGRRFDVYATVAEKEAGLSPTCPACGSTDAARVFGRVMLLRSGAPPGGGEGDFGRTERGDGEPGGDDAFDDDGFDGGEGFDGDSGLDDEGSSGGDDLDEDW